MERDYYPGKKIFASDIEVDVLSVARTNLGSNIILFEADAINTKMKKTSVDTVVTNMPWGKQVPCSDKLYYDFFKELDRILKPNGKAIILTDQTELLFDACCENGFVISVQAELSLHGLHPKIFLLKKSC